MTKCEYCNFGNYKRIIHYSPENIPTTGLYGKEIRTIDSFANDAVDLDDSTERLVKTKTGYYLETSTDGDMQYISINYCPICGRKLIQGENNDLRY